MAEDRERYWDSVRRLMIEAGAEPGDAEHLARSLIGQRDAYRRALEGVGAVAEPPTYAQEHYAGVIERAGGDVMAGPTMQPPGVYEAELIASTAQRMAEEIRDVHACLEQAQARIVELEAQAAVLVRAASDYYYQSRGHGPQEVGVASKALDTVLSNLPQAVQQHLARDRAADRIIDEVERALRHGNVPEEFAEYIDAYCAVGGDGV